MLRVLVLSLVVSVSAFAAKPNIVGDYVQDSYSQSNGDELGAPFATLQILKNNKFIATIQYKGTKTPDKDIKGTWSLKGKNLKLKAKNIGECTFKYEDNTVQEMGPAGPGLRVTSQHGTDTSYCPNIYMKK